MRLLVTGGAGFIGSNLLHLLADQPEPQAIVNLDALTYSGNEKNLERVAQDPRYQFARIDLKDSKQVLEVVHSFQIDHVMHLAAESHVDRSINSPAPFLQTNVMGTFHLLEACRTVWGSDVIGKRFLHVSTDEVYGSLGDTGTFTEESRYLPNSPYAASKAASDLVVRSYGKTFGLPIVTTHCSNNYGPYQFPEKLIPLIILKAMQSQPLPVYGTGKNVRDWIHVEDHSRALWRVLLEGKLGETYNIGGNQESTNIDLVRRICRLLDEFHPESVPDSNRSEGHEQLIHFVKDRPGHDFRYAIANNKISDTLGWQPQHNLATGLKQTVRWYLDHREWWTDILNTRYDLKRLGIESNP